MLLATFPNFVQKIIWSFSSAPQPSSHFNLYRIVMPGAG